MSPWDRKRLPIMRTLHYTNSDTPRSYHPFKTALVTRSMPNKWTSLKYMSVHRVYEASMFTTRSFFRESYCKYVSQYCVYCLMCDGSVRRSRPCTLWRQHEVCRISDHQRMLSEQFRQYASVSLKASSAACVAPQWTAQTSIYFRAASASWCVSIQHKPTHTRYLSLASSAV